MQSRTDQDASLSLVGAKDSPPKGSIGSIGSIGAAGSSVEEKCSGLSWNWYASSVRLSEALLSGLVSPVAGPSDENAKGSPQLWSPSRSIPLRRGLIDASSPDTPLTHRDKCDPMCAEKSGADRLSQSPDVHFCTAPGGHRFTGTARWRSRRRPTRGHARGGRKKLGFEVWLCSWQSLTANCV
jgi:hypothetical protein